MLEKTLLEEITFISTERNGIIGVVKNYCSGGGQLGVPVLSPLNHRITEGFGWKGILKPIWNPPTMGRDDQVAALLEGPKPVPSGGTARRCGMGSWTLTIIPLLESSCFAA